MGKYEPLGDHLRSLSDTSWNANFAEIEEILGFPLPPSAHSHRAWWSNHVGGNHSQAAVWVEAGWETREIDQRRGHVRFERSKTAGRGPRSVADDELWAQAERISGIKDRKELERAALMALVQREAARSLALMGGTMPDAVPAPRERPFE